MSQTIGRYKVLSQLGAGGMGTVYRALDPVIEREVALKLLPANFSADTSLVQRFQREARVIARLEHPHIVPIYDVGDYEGQPFIVMRLIEGGTLRERIGQPNFGLPAAVAVVEQMASALAVAHRKDIVHRDLKPANILFDQEGAAYLSDFGIAKVLDATVQLTGTGIIGTPAYMSPEQFSSAPVDGRSDQYSLAVVLFEIVSGRLPFTGDTVQVMFKHISTPAPDVRQLNPKLPTELSAVLLKALAKNAAERYSTILEFSAAVRSAAMSDPVAATVLESIPIAQTIIEPQPTALSPTHLSPAVPTTAVPPPTVTSPQPRRKRRGCLVALILLLLLVVTIGVGATQLMPGLLNGNNGGPLSFFVAPPTQTPFIATAVGQAVATGEEELLDPALTATILPTDIPLTLTPSPLPERLPPVIPSVTSSPQPSPSPTATLSPPTATSSPSPRPLPTETRLLPSATATPPAAATATAVSTTTAATPVPTNTSRPPSSVNPQGAASTGSGVPLGFESFGTWSIGTEQNGSFTQSGEQAYSGGSSAKLSYSFPTEENDYVVFMQFNEMVGTPDTLSVWVYGDGSGHFLNAWIQDDDGQTWQVPLGQVTHSGWAQLSGRIDVDQGWPWTHISGNNNDVVDYPIRFRGFVLDDGSNSYTGDGAIYLDDLTAATIGS